MKAVVVEQYETIDNVGLKDVALPDISSGQVRVKIQAASIGFVDGLKVQGLYQTKDPLPFTPPGTEFAGIVDKVAGDVTGFARGTGVMGMMRSGALAEYVTVSGRGHHRDAGWRCARSRRRRVPADLSDGALGTERACFAPRRWASAGAGCGGRCRHRRGPDRKIAGRPRDRRRLDRGET